MQSTVDRPTTCHAEVAGEGAILDGLDPYRLDDGSYRLSNEYHYLIASA